MEQVSQNAVIARYQHYYFGNALAAAPKGNVRGPQTGRTGTLPLRNAFTSPMGTSFL
jgi:hypothetical protein